MMKRNLILIHRGASYARDFDEIAEKIRHIDESICVHAVASSSGQELPPSVWEYPTLTVALMSKFSLPVRRGPILKNAAIGKLAQQALFRKNGIPTPPALPFRFGMKLDPIVFGEVVVLKPTDLALTSGPNCVFPFMRRDLERIRLVDLPPDHLARKHPDSLLVQRFINTGSPPRHFRIQSFLGRVIYCFESRVLDEEPSFDVGLETLRRTVVSTGDGGRMRELVNDEEAIRLAERAHAGLSHIPSLGFDVIRDCRSGKLWVLECNAGGNTWHFSSKDGRKLRVCFGRHVSAAGDHDELGRTAMIEQFGAFGIAARALVSKVHELAA